MEVKEMEKDGEWMDGLMDVCCCFRDAGRRTVFLRMFRFQKAGSSKFSAVRLWQRTDRRLMPWRYWQLYAVALAGAFWGLGGYIRRQLLCPQILGIEQKTKNFQLFSRAIIKRPKENSSPPGVPKETPSSHQSPASFILQHPPTLLLSSNQAFFYPVRKNLQHNKAPHHYETTAGKFLMPR